MLVSVIIPCYNVEEYIEECVESVLNQTYTNIEIICIDNNSSDGTLEKLRELKERNSKIVVNCEYTSGANSARNKGLELAHGEWIQFLDADDILEKNKIEYQINLIKKSGEVNFSFIAGASIKKFINLKEEIIYPIEGNKYLAPFLNKCGNTCANLWNREKILMAGSWNVLLKSSQETDLMFRIILLGGDYLTDMNALTIIRERENGQISQRNPLERWKQYIDIRLSYLKVLKEKSPKDYHLNKGVFYDFLMVSVLTLYDYNQTEALRYFKFIKNNWESSYTYGFNKIKVLLIKFFGLRFFVAITRI